MKTTRSCVSKLKAAQSCSRSATTGTAHTDHWQRFPPDRVGEGPGAVPISSSSARLFFHWVAERASSVPVLAPKGRGHRCGVLSNPFSSNRSGVLIQSERWSVRRGRTESDRQRGAEGGEEGRRGRGGGEEGGESLQPHLGWSFEYYQSGWSQRGRGWDVVKTRQDKESKLSQQNLFQSRNDDRTWWHSRC